MTIYDVVIKQGTVVTAVTTTQTDIGIIGEKIAAIGENLRGRQEIDAAGKLVTPGAIDVHVHMEMPIGDFTSTDSFLTGTRAAAFGGTTTIIDFVETALDETMLEALAARRAKADPKVLIDYGLHMTIGPTDIAKLDQLPGVYEAGCASFKLYMAYGLRLHDGELLKALTAVRDVGGMPVVHAENWDVICTLIEQNLAAGRVEPHWHPRSRPALLESEAAGRVIDIAEFVGTPLHIFHVSCQETVAQIAQARQRGLPIYGETCPQYLLLDWDLYDRPGVAGALPVCSPPIRERAQQAQLWAALARGDLQVVSTDHCPFALGEKESRLGNFSQIPGGVPSIEIRFPAIYHFGVQHGDLTLNQWVAACCTTPARLFGMPEKGDIAVGYDADLVIFDEKRPFTVTPESLHEAAGWTLYEGMTFQGWPQTTLSRGEIITHNGELLAQPGRGRFIKRALAAR
ncbi:MAG: dihydropyrimidinase [Chloroflexi bacterium]|nr:MAG: dihydropyrimidinase [Chloroflexota bacterium]